MSGARSFVLIPCGHVITMSPHKTPPTNCLKCGVRAIRGQALFVSPTAVRTCRPVERVAAHLTQEEVLRRRVSAVTKDKIDKHRRTAEAMATLDKLNRLCADLEKQLEEKRLKARKLEREANDLRRKLDLVKYKNMKV